MTRRPAGPRLDWPGRGRPVVRDAKTGRWRHGDHTSASITVLARHGAAHSPNLLIHGEAYAALAALPADVRFRLCYIDPPFNTGQEFDDYDDRSEHGVWLSCLEERIIAARARLEEDGAFFVVHVNVVEQPYLRVLLDELFGRDRLVAQIAWQRAPDRTLLGQGDTLVADQVEYLLVYAHGDVPADWPRPQRILPLAEKTLLTYSRTMVPSAGARVVDEFVDSNGQSVTIHRHESYDLRTVPVATLRRAAADSELRAAFPRLMRLTNQQAESTFQQELLRRMPEPAVLYRAEFQQRRGKHKGKRSRYYLNGQVVLWLRDVAVLHGDELQRVADLNNFWPADEIPATGIAGEGGVTMRRGKKPERLLERVISAFSRPGDRVLDFFGGSGTTAAVAERLGRRWVLVEAGAHARTLAEPRLIRAVAATGGGFVLASV